MLPVPESTVASAVWGAAIVGAEMSVVAGGQTIIGKVNAYTAGVPTILKLKDRYGKVWTISVDAITALS